MDADLVVRGALSRPVYDHWQTAGRLDAALMRFAETGRGVELLARDNPRQVRLRVAGAEAFLELDPFERIAYIRRIFRRP